MEKHIIFLYPLHPVIQELKDLLEKEGGYDINEIDDVNEYKQLIGVIGNSITLTSDVRKIHSSLDAQKNLIKNGSSKVILMGKFQNQPHEVGQLRVMGVQEILPETTPLKSLQFKLNLFLKAFETAEVQKEKERLQEEKKNKKVESKKIVPLFVNNEKEKPSQEPKKPQSEEESAFDFKEMVKSSFTPLNIKPVEEKKKKKMLKPLFENKDYAQKHRPKSGGLIFNEVPEEVDEVVDNEDREAKTKAKGKYNPLRLATDKAAAIAEKKKELEEAAEKIKQYRESLRLAEEEKKATHKALRLQEADEEVSGDEDDDEDKKKLAKKKYQSLKVGEGDKEDEIDEENDPEKRLVRKKYQPLKLNQADENDEEDEANDEEKKKRKHYTGLRLQSEKEKKESQKPEKKLRERDRNNALYQDKGNELEDEIEASLDEESLEGDVLDYSEDEKAHIGGEYNPEPEKNPGSYDGEEDEEYLQYPEFYWPPSGVSTFIPFLLEILQKRPFSQDKYMQFICFMFFRKLGGQLTYVIERGNTLELLVSTHQLDDKSWKLEKVYSAEKLAELSSVTTPTWSDNTFQEPYLEFVFPFYFNKERLGFAHAVFDGSKVKNLQEALEVELLIVTARTVFLKEFGF